MNKIASKVNFVLQIRDDFRNKLYLNLQLFLSFNIIALYGVAFVIGSTIFL